MKSNVRNYAPLLLTQLGFALVLAAATPSSVDAHGTVVFPKSRVYRVYEANPDNPSFGLAAQAVAIDGTLSYYTWNELSRNISEAVVAGLPPAFDYSPWCPDGQIASGGRVDPMSGEYPRTYAGLDQVSPDWPTTTLQAGATIEVDFLATAPHSPSVWDVWMTTPDWQPTQPLNWSQLEYLGRPTPILDAGHYLFDLQLPSDRTGHHVLWVAWHRNDPVGEVFFSTSDILFEGGPVAELFVRADCNDDDAYNIGDPVALLATIFPAAGTTPDAPVCPDSCDCNDDGNLDVADAICLLAGLFLGQPPLAPYPACGQDPTLDILPDCVTSSSCP